MNENWFEVFKAGRHTDSNGNTRDWTPEDLEKIASSYNPQEHEAPIVIGHPETDSPAYGWIEALKVEGEKLLAKPRQLVEELKDWVRKGLYKKVSIALYPDLTLRHIGFLGAEIPAIKGLGAVRFREGEITVCFSDIEKGGIEMNSKMADPGKEIQRRIKEVLRDPTSHVNKYGVRFSENATYSQAFTYVCEEDPELAKAYAESLRPTKMTPEEEKSLAAGKRIVDLVNEKMRNDKGLSYSEALTKVQIEYRDLVLEYIGKK